MVVVSNLQEDAFLTPQTLEPPQRFTYGQRYDAMGRVTGTIAPDPDGVSSGDMA